MRTRCNVFTLIANENTDWPAALVSYQKGVAAMRGYDPPETTPATRPTNNQSWQYLAAVHGRALDGKHGKRGEKPDTSDPLWSQCQHGSWFFFPWHRMYLLTLESFIQHYSGDADWSVPYWYAVDPDNPKTCDVLPKAFRDPSGGNALYIKERSTFAQAGQSVFGSVLLSLLSHTFHTNLRQQIFSINKDSFPIDDYFGFGGAEYKDQDFNHGQNGAIEAIPHGSTHDYVGSDFDRDGTVVGTEGFMSDLKTAARDPIFWLHHANIDRLWQMWLDLDPDHRNPHDKDWLKSSFKFPTPDGEIKEWSVGDVLDTADLGYRYDTVAAPGKIAVGAPSRGLRAREVGPRVSVPTPAERPRVIGATVSVPLLADRRADIPLSAPSVQSRALVADPTPPAPQQWLLSLEGITGTVATSGYGVYVNVPAGAVAAEHPDRLAGIISTFGVRDASAPRGEHGGSGLTFVFDITGVHDALEADGQWDPGNVSVAFVPLVPPVADEAALAEPRAAAPSSTPDLRATRIAVLVR
jgi:tyrosinase